jgi:hypothetical protein
VKHHFDVSAIVVSQVKLLFLSVSLLLFFISLFLYPIITYLLRLVEKLSKRISKVDYIVIGTVAFLIVQLLMNPHYKICDWAAPWYVVDYSMGIGSRFFIGSVLNLLCGGFIYSRFAVAFCYLFYTAIIVSIVKLTSVFAADCNQESRMGFVFIWILFLVNPGSVVSLWMTETFGRLEIYCFLISLICLLLYAKYGLNVITTSVITILSSISMAIYQGNIFMYYSIVMMIYIWEVISHPRSVSKWIYVFINLVATSITFLYFQFFSFTTFDSSLSMMSALSSKTDMAMDEMVLEYAFFQPVTVAFNQVNTKSC